jgi:hypothetical protein
MAIGYSVVHLARGMGEGGVVVTIEPSDEMISASTGYLKRAGLLDRVEIERGKALDVMPNLTETFDLLFIDAVKEEYSQYLDLGLPRLRKRRCSHRRQFTLGRKGCHRRHRKLNHSAARIQFLLHQPSATARRSAARGRRSRLRGENNVTRQILSTITQTLF